MSCDYECVCFNQSVYVYGIHAVVFMYNLTVSECVGSDECCVEQLVCVCGLICGRIGGLLGCLMRDCGVIQLGCDLCVSVYRCA